MSAIAEMRQRRGLTSKIKWLAAIGLTVAATSFVYHSFDPIELVPGPDTTAFVQALEHRAEERLVDLPGLRDAVSRITGARADWFTTSQALSDAKELLASTESGKELSNFDDSLRSFSAAKGLPGSEALEEEIAKLNALRAQLDEAVVALDQIANQYNPKVHLDSRFIDARIDEIDQVISNNGLRGSPFSGVGHGQSLGVTIRQFQSSGGYGHTAIDVHLAPKW